MPIGQPIREGVVRQIEARQKKMESMKRGTDEALNYMASRNAWIKVSSSVNTLSDSEAVASMFKKGSTGDETKAKNNVLYSFGLDKNGREGGDFISSADGTDRSINSGGLDKGGFKLGGAYTKTSTQGIRPNPGVTGFTAKSKGTYGTLRECTVNFNVYSLEDLELMNDLYFRPGYTMLVEWGHTSYILDNGVPNSEILVVQDYFKNGHDQYDIQEQIVKLQKKTNYNYDAICGFVKNFNYSFVNPGYYECSIDVIARGEVIESLMSDFDPISHFGAEHFSDKDDEKGKSQRKSAFHFICETLNDMNEGDEITKAEILDEVDTLGPYILDDAVFPSFKQDLADTGMIFEDTVRMVYITIRDLLHIFNQAIMPKDSNNDNTKLTGFNIRYNHERVSDTGDVTEIVNTNFLKIDNHFSIDPYICFLYDLAQADNLKNEVRLVIGGLFSGGGGGITGGNDIQKTVQKRAEKAHNNSGLDARYQDGKNSILDISVSTHYILEILDTMYDKDGNTDKGVVDFFKPFLAGINDALGGINELDLYFNEDDQLFYVVDRKLDTPRKCPRINVTGLDSIVQDLSISSKISNEMASMISISAQPTVTESNEDKFYQMFKWNKGKVDRIVAFKDQRDTEKGSKKGSEATPDRKQEQYESWIEDIDDTFGRFCNRFARNMKYRKSDHDALRSFHKSWSQEQLFQDKNAKGDPIPGVIPLEVGLKLDGIAGLRVAEAFYINGTDIIPKQYEKFGYIITSLSHTIEQNRWVTDIGTQFYNIEVPSKEEQAKYQELKNEQNKKRQIADNTTAAFETANFDPKQALDGTNVDYDLLQRAIEEEGHPWSTQKHVLNMVGIRNMRGAKNTSYGVTLPGTNHFDDLICVAYIDENGKKQAQSFAASTDPGFSMLVKPINQNGCAIMVEGHYKDCWSVGTHGRGGSNPHTAFKQSKGKVKVYRDKTTDTIYDLDRRTIQEGYFGINIHKGSRGTSTGSSVNGWSAGCQIFKNGAQQIKVMTLAKKQRDLAGKSTYSYSLIRSTNKVIKEANLI